MKRIVSLFQFMPYGAPELLAARRDHTSRALVLASSLAVGAWLVAIPLATMLRGALPAEVRLLDPIIDLVPPPLYVPPPPPSTAPRQSAPSAPDQGVPLPVPDSDAPKDPLPTVQGSIGEGPVDANAAPSSPTGTVFAPPTPDKMPALGEFVAVDELPEPVVLLKPVYPDFAREAGVEGLVIVHALIGKDGRVIRVVLDPKHSIPLLDETALEASKRWVFKPAFANGHPVPVWFAIPFHFVLHERGY